MSALAREVYSELAQGSDGREITCTVSSLAPAAGDPAMIRQVLVNLIANAIKFTATRATAVIEVGSQTGDGETVYFVRDNGVGFDMQYAGQLFGVFSRLHGSHEFEGTGIGLAIVKRVVEKHGGRVWAESAPDQGATFFFSLPA
jgi:light-regulated signal transduction histidine kinase (bacteriophytochrome)